MQWQCTNLYIKTTFVGNQSVCWLIEIHCNDALGVHSLNHCTIAAGSENSIVLPSLTNNTSFSIVIALLWNGGTLFISVSVIHCSNSIFHMSTNGRDHMFSLPDAIHLCHTPSDHTNTHTTECQSALRLCSYSFPPDYVFLMSVITPRQRAGPAHFRIHHKQFTRH